MSRVLCLLDDARESDSDEFLNITTRMVPAMSRSVPSRDLKEIAKLEGRRALLVIVESTLFLVCQECGKRVSKDGIAYTYDEFVFPIRIPDSHKTESPGNAEYLLC